MMRNKSFEIQKTVSLLCQNLQDAKLARAFPAMLIHYAMLNVFFLLCDRTVT